MNLETGNEPVEENCLESKICDIQAKTLDEQPDNGRKLEPFLPEEITDITTIPVIINPKRMERAFRLSFTKTINPKTTKMISVTTLSIFAKSQGEYLETSMIFTKKSSFISRSTTMAILATNNIMRKGIKFLNNSQRCFPFSVARSDFIAISSSVGCGRRSRAYPSNAKRAVRQLRSAQASRTHSHAGYS